MDIVLTLQSAVSNQNLNKRLTNTKAIEQETGIRADE